MKRITILLAMLLSAITLTAQEAKTYHEQMKIMTSELDATRFTNNTLYDKVYPLANLKSFNQNEQKDTSNYKHFKQAVHELYLAGDKQVIRSVKDIDQSAISLKMNNKVLVGIINMDISHIKTDAYDVANKKMHIDSTGATKKMIEIADKEPYETLQTLVVSPLQGRIKQVSGQPVVFNFLQGMIQKSTNPIKTLNVDFGNGVNHNVITNRRIVNIEVSYSFPSEGNYTLKFSGVYQDGTAFETYGAITIPDILPTPPVEPNFIRATETFTPYIPDTDRPTTGFTTNFEDDDTGEYISELPRVNYKIYLADGHTNLQKPIIIVDGIDWNGDKNRDANDIYIESLEIKGTGEYSGVLFGDILYAEEHGYDVIIVDFPIYEIGTKEVMNCLEVDDYNNCQDWEMVEEKVHRKGGADYIQRNAQVVKEMIRYVNAKLATNGSDEELVVVGPSMGGLVTRFALKEMELAGEDHNTRMWLAFDSPLQGANIPMSMQYFAKWGDDEDSLDRFERSATKQMVVHHVDAAEPMWVYETPMHTIYGPDVVSEGAPAFRNQFKSDLNDISYPNNLIRVALVNGSSTGETNNTPGQKIAHLDLWMDTIPWGNAGNVNLYFTENNAGHNRTNRFMIRDGLFTWNETKTYVNTDSSIGSYDTAPGCTYDIEGDLTDHWLDNIDSSSLGIFGNIWIDGDLVQYVDEFTFMPTKSTLDFQSTNKKLRDPICHDLVHADETPFDTYYAPEYNEQHVELNTANVTWLLEVLASEGLDDLPCPQTYCEPTIAAIQGDNKICFDDEKTYFVELNTCQHESVAWSTSSNLDIISFTDTEITVKSTETGTESLHIYATFDTGEVVPKHLVGEASFTINVIEDPIFPTLQLQSDGTPFALQGIVDVFWNVDPESTGVLTPSTSSYSAIASSPSSGEWFVTGTVSVFNSCGEVEKNFYVNGGDCDEELNIQAVVGTDNLYLVDDPCDNGPDGDPEPLYIDASEIYDIYGIKIQDLEPNIDELNIENTGSTGDVRIIKAEKDGKTATKRVVIK